MNTINFSGASHKNRTRINTLIQLVGFPLNFQTDLPATFIDVVTNTTVNVSNAVLGRSYRLALNTKNIWSYLIRNSPGVVGITIGAYDSTTNKTVYPFDNFEQAIGTSFVFKGSVKIYMYGLLLGDIVRVPFSPLTQFATILIQ